MSYIFVAEPPTKLKGIIENWRNIWVL